MIEHVFGERGSGKTTKLLTLAKEKGYVVIEPNYRMKVYAQELAKKIGCEEVVIIAAHEYLRQQIQGRQYRYLLDELDACLPEFGILGYSASPNEQKSEEKDRSTCYGLGSKYCFEDCDISCPYE